MPIGVICAMPQEIAHLQKDMQTQESVVIAGRTFCKGLLYGKDTVLVMSNIGKVATAVTTTLLIERFGAEQIIFSGTAGGIHPDVHVGDVIVADRCVQHDFSVDETPTFRIPIIDKSYFETNDTLSRKALQAAKYYLADGYRKDLIDETLERLFIYQPKAITGTIASGDQFISNNDKNNWLLKNIKNIQCVEMEGAALAQVCYEYQIPFTVIRVISDGANQESPVSFVEFVEEAAQYFTRGIILKLFDLI